MTNFQEHALINALEEISKRDPEAEGNDGNCVCRRYSSDYCLGCVARNALKAFKKETANV